MRRLYGWLACGVIAFALYASLLPFRLRDRAIATAWSEFVILLLDPKADPASRANMIANVLLFVPIGFALVGVRLAERERSARLVPAALMAVAGSLFVSVVAEFLQMFVRGRVPSRLDILAQSIGCLIGIAAWVSTGPSLTDWLRSRSQRSPSDRLTRFLVGYAALWLLANLAPFDITVDVGHLARRVRAGFVTIVPFGSPEPLSRQIWDAVAAALSAIPLGMLALVGWADDGTRRRAGRAWLLGASAVVAVEAAQIFIRSHAADITDVIFGWLGVALGVWVGIRLFKHTAAASSGPLGVARGTSLILTGLWALVVCGYHWQPFDFGTDMALIRSKVSTISLIPFATYQTGEDLNALNNLITKIAVAGPLGLLASFTVPARRLLGRVLIVSWIALAGLFFAAVEVGQLFVPSRVPDPTDVLLGVAASAAGVWLGRWLRRR